MVLDTSAAQRLKVQAESPSLLKHQAVSCHVTLTTGEPRTWRPGCTAALGPWAHRLHDPAPRHQGVLQRKKHGPGREGNVWLWRTHLPPLLRRLRQDPEFEPSVDHIREPHLGKKPKRGKNKIEHHVTTELWPRGFLCPSASRQVLRMWEVLPLSTSTSPGTFRGVGPMQHVSP